MPCSRAEEKLELETGHGLLLRHGPESDSSPALRVEPPSLIVGSPNPQRTSMPWPARAANRRSGTCFEHIDSSPQPFRCGPAQRRSPAMDSLYPVSLAARLPLSSSSFTHEPPHSPTAHEWR